MRWLTHKQPSSSNKGPTSRSLNPEARIVETAIPNATTHHHHHHCIFVFLEDIMQSTVFIRAFLSSQIFSRLSRSFSWSSDRLMLEYLEISLKIRLSHVVFGLPADLFHVFTKTFSHLLAGVSEGNRSR